jgi:hypothetical protein
MKAQYKNNEAQYQNNEAQYKNNENITRTMTHNTGTMKAQYKNNVAQHKNNENNTRTMKHNTRTMNSKCHRTTKNTEHTTDPTTALGLTQLLTVPRLIPGVKLTGA